MKEHSGRFLILSLIDSQNFLQLKVTERDLAKFRSQCDTKRMDSPKYCMELLKDLNSIMNFASSMESDFKLVSESIRGALETQQLLKAAARDDMTTMESLINQGVNVNQDNQDGQTAFHMAIKQGASRNMIDLLLGRGGTDLTLQDERGITALHFAVERNEGLIVESLLDKQAHESPSDKKANVTAENNDGKTPEDLAAESRDRKKNCRNAQTRSPGTSQGTFKGAKRHFYTSSSAIENRGPCLRAILNDCCGSMRLERLRPALVRNMLCF